MKKNYRISSQLENTTNNLRPFRFRAQGRPGNSDRRYLVMKSKISLFSSPTTNPFFIGLLNGLPISLLLWGLIVAGILLLFR